ncbi:MAG: hypothetical protein ACYS47_02955 [Planctomycetota bacterium]
MPREEARALEEDFHGRLRGRLGALREVFNPLDGRVYFVDPALSLKHWDQGEKVKRVMLAEGVLDRSVRRSMPSNRATRLDVGTKGLISGFTPVVSVAGVSLSPLKPLAVEGETEAPVEFPDLESAVKRVADRHRVFHYVGVFATTSFSEECVAQPPRSRNLVTVLVERGADSEWVVLNREGFPWPGTPALFDLETIAEKVDRCRRTILEHEDLRLRGGHVRLSEIRAELGFSEDVFDRALGQILDGPEEFQVRELDGTQILQRPRF